jgi:hypothetical protein
LAAYLQSDKAEEIQRTLNTGWTSLADKEFYIRIDEASAELCTQNETPSTSIKSIEVKNLLIDIGPKIGPENLKKDASR